MSEDIAYQPFRVREARLKEEAIRTYARVFQQSPSSTVIGGAASPEELEQMRALLPVLKQQIFGTP
jgi:hypothetical protein